VLWVMWREVVRRRVGGVDDGMGSLWGEVWEVCGDWKLASWRAESLFWSNLSFGAFLFLFRVIGPGSEIVRCGDGARSTESWACPSHT